MQRIVVSFEKGDGFECGSYLNIYRFRYESPEAWLIQFEEALDKAIETWTTCNTASHEWLKKRPAEKCKDEKIWQQWVDSNPRFQITEYFTFCNHEWSIFDFWTRSTNEKDLPEVMELEEWFDKSQVV